jgi:NADH:ubiquinone oxidoreductase subunit H
MSSETKLDIKLKQGAADQIRHFCSSPSIAPSGANEVEYQANQEPVRPAMRVLPRPVVIPARLRSIRPPLRGWAIPALLGGSIIYIITIMALAIYALCCLPFSSSLDAVNS